MKTVKLFYTFLFALISLGNANSQNKPLAAVLHMETKGVVFEPSQAGSILRMELEKTERYIVLDRYDMEEVLSSNSLTMEECYSRQCLLNAGKALNVDKVLFGSIERFGEKLVISLREVNIKSEQIEKTQIFEYLNLQPELHRMITLSVRAFYKLPYDEQSFNVLKYYDAPVLSEHSNISNQGPRMGMSYVTGDLAQRLQDSEGNGGYDAYPLLSHFGYQFEAEYLSAGNFHALFETLILVSGMEQQLFIPSVIIMNGFRGGKSGFEIGFGPSFNLSRKKKGYFDNEGNWYLENEWNDPDNPNPYPSKTRIDSRGKIGINTAWVWGIGKTFRSGHLNIPINVYVTPSKSGWYIGSSVGFNVSKRKPNQ